MTPDELEQFLRDAFPANPPPLKVEAITEAGVLLRRTVSSAEERPGGTVSGPALMGLADTAAWLSVLSRIGLVALAVTTSLHIDFLRKPALVDVFADGRVLKLGSRLAVVDVSMWSADGSPDELVAKAQVTYSIPPRR
ncbi:MAG TPA: PaaI family thioesterase [Acidimicrobiales bacterium]|nr:PaaI family thioesterase [Acidimicrobiales bacterium]